MLGRAGRPPLPPRSPPQHFLCTSTLRNCLSMVTRERSLFPARLPCLPSLCLLYLMAPVSKSSRLVQPLLSATSWTFSTYRVCSTATCQSCAAAPPTRPPRRCCASF